MKKLEYEIKKAFFISYIVDYWKKYITIFVVNYILQLSYFKFFIS